MYGIWYKECLEITRISAEVQAWWKGEVDIHNLTIREAEAKSSAKAAALSREGFADGEEDGPIRLAGCKASATYSHME